MEPSITISALIAFITLCGLEIVLGVDNIIFISILCSKLPTSEQNKARLLGLGLAVITRVGLLLSLSWVIGLTAPLFSIFGQEISGRDLILLSGGLFLIGKSTHEIHQKMESIEETQQPRPAGQFYNVIAQILILDIVFSLDSVITAVGMVSDIRIMIAAVVVSTVFMMFTSRTISNFVDEHPTIKILSLSFLILIGVTLIAEGFNQHISKGYVYFAMGFSLFVESLNLRLKKKSKPIHLNKSWDL
jgi:predicted tellurium resistance membrane protein TerC